jgi:hypothetical protein
VQVASSGDGGKVSKWSVGGDQTLRRGDEREKRERELGIASERPALFQRFSSLNTLA